MKNSIPLILAVLLGLAAVFAVSKIISTNTAKVEEKVKIVAATRDLAAGEEASMAISGTAKAWQLRALAKIAFLVGQAAGSRDFAAVKDLLPVLCGAVERKIQELRINR